MDLGSQGESALLNQGLEGGQQQRKRRAQFVAYIGEKAAFDAIKLEKFSVRVLQHPPTFVQLITNFEFSKEQSGIKIISGDNDNAGQNKKIEIIKEIPEIKVYCVGIRRTEIHQYDTADRNHCVAETPMPHSANGEQY